MTGYNSADVDNGPVPTIDADVGAGSGATVSIEGNDKNGKITIISGTGASTGLIATIGFARQRDATHFYPVISGGNAQGGNAIVNMYAARIDDFTWGLYRAVAALSNTTTYVWHYFIP